jgi:hypothetical protein
MLARFVNGSQRRKRGYANPAPGNMANGVRGALINPIFVRNVAIRIRIDAFQSRGTLVA